MAENENTNDELLKRLNKLLERQDELSGELRQIREELTQKDKPKPESAESEVEEPAEITEPEVEEAVAVVDEPKESVQEEPVASEQTAEETSKPEPVAVNTPPDWTRKSFSERNKGQASSSGSGKSNLEKFIGENLLNKIGILITIIGVAIGAKYSIDNNLISPLVRIILGYVTGLGLLGVGLKLRKNYLNYSAVLVSGAMAIMYFITYFGFSFYGLFPASVAFALMLLFTLFTVGAAISYNLQIIAHIGLVGAYAVPFLLSDGSGRVMILFSYMTIINAGILVLALRKYWKELYYSSFGLTWFIYFFWFATEYDNTKHFGVFSVFLLLFFLVFYGIFLAYKVRLDKKFQIDDIILLLANSFLFYGLGYLLLEQNSHNDDILGLFTVCNSLLHVGVSRILKARKLSDRNLYFMVLGLAVVFITIAIPVQLDGSWVTLLWAGEAALLFTIGRSMSGPVYERISYPIMLLCLFSLLEDWNNNYDVFGSGNTLHHVTPVLNITFLTSLMVIAAFTIINYVNASDKYESQLKQEGLSKIMGIGIPVILLGLVYVAVRLELDNYANILYQESKALSPYDAGNKDILHFKAIWAINYTLLYISGVSLVNMYRVRNKDLGQLNVVVNLVALFVFLLSGLYYMSELRESYLSTTIGQVFKPTIMHLLIRYISFVFVGGLLYTTYRYLKQEFMDRDFSREYGCIMHAAILWILSSEIIHWMDMTRSSESYGLGLSILWGCYSLLLVSLGIWKSRKELRYMAIGLFGITLAKLFFYDIADLGTIAKTIVFVSLGILLLIISFLYNKYKGQITDD